MGTCWRNTSGTWGTLFTTYWELHGNALRTTNKSNTPNPPPKEKKKHLGPSITACCLTWLVVTFIYLLVGTRDLWTLWSPPVSLNQERHTGVHRAWWAGQTGLGTSPGPLQRLPWPQFANVCDEHTNRQMAALVVLPAMPSSSSFLPFFFHVSNQGPDIFETWNPLLHSLRVLNTDPSFLDTWILSSVAIAFSSSSKPQVSIFLRPEISSSCDDRLASMSLTQIYPSFLETWNILLCCHCKFSSSDTFETKSRSPHHLTILVVSMSLNR